LRDERTTMTAVGTDWADTSQDWGEGVPSRGWRESANGLWMDWRKHKRLVRRQCLRLGVDRTAFGKERA
jgi:hypothetical protein